MKPRLNGLLCPGQYLVQIGYMLAWLFKAVFYGGAVATAGAYASARATKTGNEASMLGDFRLSGPTLRQDARYPQDNRDAEGDGQRDYAHHHGPGYALHPN